MKLKSIRKRFWVLSMLVMAVLLVFGAFVAHRVDRVGQLGTEIQGAPSIINDAARRIEINVIKIHREMKDVVLLMDEADQAKAIRNVNELEVEVYEDIALIDAKALGEEGRRLLVAGKELFDEWKPIRDGVIDLVMAGRYEEARDITRGRGASHVAKLQIAFSTLSEHAKGHITESLDEIRSRSESVFAAFLAASAVMLTLVVFINVFTFKGILVSLEKLKDTMGDMVRTKVFRKADISGDKEIEELGERFNDLIGVLKGQLDLKQKVTELHSSLSDVHRSKDLAELYLTYVTKAAGAEYGAFYIQDRRAGGYRLAAGCATPEAYPFKRVFGPGEGLIGRVGASGNPAALENLTPDRVKLKSGAADVVPNSLFVYPVLHGKKSVCVVEMAKTETFKIQEREFLLLSAEALAPYVMGVWREEKVNDLLGDAEAMNAELEAKSIELEQNAKELQHLNRELEQNANELEQVNRELDRQKTELIEKGRDLTKANNLKSDFLANISHELRTPLNSIILLSDMMLKRDSSDAEERDKLQVIRNAGGELLELINNLLDISKIESGKMDVYMEPTSTIHLGERLRHQFESMAESKGLGFEVLDEAGTELVTDRQKLLQILTNFLSNAFKFTEEGHVRVRISKSRQPGCDLVFTVEDTGIGIREDYKASIFEAFIQGDGSITREYGGTGLGLAICKKMADLLGGVLTMESIYREGSVFSVHLPENPYVEDDEAKTITEREPGLDLQIDSKEADGDGLSDPVKPGGRHVLLIEDDEAFAATLKTHVNRMGYDLVHARTGYDGIVKAGRTRPDGIILDLVLPDISGARALREIKMNPLTRGIPVHVLTVKEESEALSLKRMGAVGFTRKTPQVESDAREVLDGIEKVIRKKPKSILIVEDDSREVEVLRGLLKEWKIAIDSADSVAAAMESMKNRDYDAVVVDLGLKDGSGWEICRHVKEEDLSCPVVVYTAKTLSEKEHRNLKKYSDSIILKSADSRGDLLEEIAIFIHKVYEWQEERANVTGYEALAGKTILICDDDARNVFALSSLLEEFGVEVLEAYNGEEAIDLLESGSRVDLVLMDIMMPKMDGITAMRRIREMKEYKELPIIALTAKAMKGDKENCLAAGASDYLWKPVDMDMLLKLIVLWVGGPQ